MIEQIFSSIEELVDGKLVCGAGGGGFLQVILKKGVTRQMIEERLKEYRTGDTTVVLEVDGDVFGKAVYKSNQKQSQIYGTKLAGVAT